MTTKNADATARPLVLSWRTSPRLALAGVVFSFMVLHQLYTVYDTTRLLSTHCRSYSSSYSSSSPDGTAGSSNNNEPRQELAQQQDEDKDKDNSSENSTTPFLLETFALSFDPTKVERLQERNNHSNLGSIVWVPGTDGMQQRTLDLWAQLTNHGHASMTVEQAAQLHKYHYESPHAVGCYLAHWHLLRTLAQRPPELLQLQLLALNDDDKNKQHQQRQQQPNNKTVRHAYLILEDDAACAPGLKEAIERTIQQLPSDWDMLFVGGKPFSYFDEWNNHNNNVNGNETSNQTMLPKLGNVTHGKLLLQEYQQIADAATYNGTAMDSIVQRIRHAVCQGDFGRARGPLAPDGSRRLLPPSSSSPDGTTDNQQQQQHQAYWRSDYLTNTHSYVVNPQRIGHVAKLLHPTADVPVDIRLGDLMQSRQINVYMTTRMWCDQKPISSDGGDARPAARLLAPQTWPGFFAFSKGRPQAWHYIWQTQMHLADDVQEDCAF